jgi:AcrR family transcriptional regulator
MPGVTTRAGYRDGGVIGGPQMAADAGAAPRRRDAKATKDDILRVATEMFAEKGFAGARVDEIAELIRTTKRMIYYYFESKEGLYLRVLERAYAGIREMERGLDVTGLPPVDALRQLAEVTYDHDTRHRDFVRLVAVENVHHASHIEGSQVIYDLNRTAIDTLQGVLARGVEEGVFRDDVDALDLHMLLSSFPIFAVANRYTFRTLFGRDPLDPERQDINRRLAGDMIVRLMLR